MLHQYGLDGFSFWLVRLRFFELSVLIFDCHTIVGLAHRTAEKQRPGPLDLALLFQEVVKVKKISRPTASMRELLLGSIQEYNRIQTTKAWKVSETDRKLIYNCIRSPVLLAALKIVGDRCPWQHSAFTMENLDGDFYVPNTILAPNHASQTWKEIKDQ